MALYDAFMSKMTAVLERLSSKLAPIPQGNKLNKLGYILIGCWFVFWSIIPMISLKGTFIDILENIVWGSHFQFGYDKNPYLGAWIGYAGYALTGGSIWINYVLSQVFVCLGLLMTWKLARRLLPPPEAFLSMLFMWGVTFYGMKATELCDDVMELGFWPLTVYFFYRALKDSQRLRDWVLVGILAGCCFMIKYYGWVLFASMALVVLFTQEGRKSFRHAGIYVAALIFIVITLPNILFLLQHDMVAIDYAMRRAGVAGAGFGDHFKYPLRAIERAFGALVVSLVAYLVLFITRRKKESGQSGVKFDQVFLNIICWGPFSFTLLFSLITGGRINYSWVLPCFALLGVYFFYYYRPLIKSFNFRAAIAIMILAGIIFGSIFVIRSTWHQGYRKKSSDYENFPGQEVSRLVTSEWHALTGKPLPYVIAERNEACHMAIFSPDRPEPYFSANPLFSNWINEEKLLQEGAAVVLYWPMEAIPSWYHKLKQKGIQMTPLVTVEFDRAVPDWFVKLVGKPPKKVPVSYCFILPKPQNP